jgi:hypothetical protein
MDAVEQAPTMPEPSGHLSAHQFKNQDQAEMDGPLGSSGQPNGSASGAGIMGTFGQVGTAGW